MKVKICTYLEMSEVYIFFAISQMNLTLFCEETNEPLDEIESIQIPTQTGISSL
jgi:hypothetical protein